MSSIEVLLQQRVDPIQLTHPVPDEHFLIGQTVGAVGFDPMQVAAMAGPSGGAAVGVDVVATIDAS